MLVFIDIFLLKNSGFQDLDYGINVKFHYINYHKSGLDMIGLSKKDKEEILEFPKKYGIIIRGMHMEMIELKQKVSEHRESIFKERDKLRVEILKTNNEYERTHHLCSEIEQKLSSGIRSIEETTNLIKGLELSVKQKADLVNEKHDEVSTVIRKNEAKHKQLLTSILNSNQELKKEVYRADERHTYLEEELKGATKMVKRLYYAIIIVAIFAIVSLTLHIT